MTSVTAIAQGRRHCFNACMATLRQCSTRPPGSLPRTCPRSVSIGTKRPTPTSTAFCTAQSIARLSIIARANVTPPGIGSASWRTDRISASTRPFPIATNFASAITPFPSASTISSPGRRRSAPVRWRASVGSRTTVRPVSRTTGYREQPRHRLHGTLPPRPRQGSPNHRERDGTK